MTKSSERRSSPFTASLVTAFSLTAFLWTLGTLSARAADDGILVTPVSYDRTPAYGSFTPTKGRWYGRAMPVSTADQAVRLLESYYSPRGLSVQQIVERGTYYEARIARGSLMVDRVILFKRTGRIRSVY